jgi:hypothetical protein
MLEKLQQQLNEIYRTDAGVDVREFLITDEAVAQCLSNNTMLEGVGETLLLKEEADGLAMSLYLERGVLDRLESSDAINDLQTNQLDDLCKVIEGLSHFNYMVWKAGQDRTVSLLELELQAEIDKFVSTMQLARDQGDSDLLNGLYRRLFDRVTFRENLDEEQQERYRSANEYAARFCRNLRNKLTQDRDSALNELRAFYRLQLPEKISHIHSTAWTSTGSG